MNPDCFEPRLLLARLPATMDSGTKLMTPKKLLAAIVEPVVCTVVSCAQLPPAFTPTYQPHQAQGGGGGATGAKSAASAGPNNAPNASAERITCLFICPP